MRKILAAALVSSLVAGSAPAFADGDYLVGGRTASQAWSQPTGFTPRAATSGDRQRFPGGDDQYVVGATASAAWSQPDDRVMLASSRDPVLGNFTLSSQGT